MARRFAGILAGELGRLAARGRFALRAHGATKHFGESLVQTSAPSSMSAWFQAAGAACAAPFCSVARAICQICSSPFFSPRRTAKPAMRLITRTTLPSTNASGSA